MQALTSMAEMKRFEPAVPLCVFQTTSTSVGSETARQIYLENDPQDGAIFDQATTKRKFANSSRCSYAGTKRNQLAGTKRTSCWRRLPRPDVPKSSHKDANGTASSNRFISANQSFSVYDPRAEGRITRVCGQFRAASKSGVGKGTPSRRANPNGFSGVMKPSGPYLSANSSEAGNEVRPFPVVELTRFVRFFFPQPRVERPCARSDADQEKQAHCHRKVRSSVAYHEPKALIRVP